MSLKITALSAAVVLLSPGRTAGQSSWSQYKPGSLVGVIQQERGDIVASIRAGRVPLTVTSANGLPTLAVVQYEDSTRLTPPAHLHVLTAWAKSLQRPLDMETMFRSEVLFREDTLRLWLPIQSALLPAMQKELRRGDRVALYVGYIGAQAHDSTTIEWVFVINEFEKK